jgi:hypothetical protein
VAKRIKLDKVETQPGNGEIGGIAKW